ncbi:GlxA family transcriptional regulator [Aliisedimentitalea scapharcae]|uniref:GlxA family transcriptional regulator n=1 Tax=Aliisedimentitalea scapharcae TaxID=1524259 RepID=A0ABZ2XQ01_9RHOB
MSLTHALETLRIANRMAGSKRFDWVICAENGETVEDSLGARFPVDHGFEEAHRDDVVIVCSGQDVQKQPLTAVTNWIRRCARNGCRIGGLFTGAYVLAKSGLLDGHAATIHWENRQAFLEEFPEVNLTEYTFVCEGSRLSTAGGTAAIDLILHMVAEAEGEALSNLVADQLHYTNIRVLQFSARMQVADRIGFRHPKLSEILALMETNLEEPLRPGDLAETVNISTRQLERLFRRYLHSTPKKYYVDMRLQRAQNLLLQTNMSVTNVCVACGFNSTSHFARLFRQRYGVSPHRLRKGQPSGDGA